MRFIWIAISAVVLFSCSEKVEKRAKPEQLMNETDLIQLIIDLQILESHYHRKYSRPDVYKNALDSACHYVFEKHETTRDIFESSYDYYAEDPDYMYKIYEATLDTINYRVSASQQ